LEAENKLEKDEKIPQETRKPFEPVIPEISDKTPFADEMWDFYFNKSDEKDPNVYLGDFDADKKVRGLLSEVNEYILNNTIIDITKPVREEIKTGELYVVGDTHGSFGDTDKIIRYFVKKIKEIEEIQEDEEGEEKKDGEEHENQKRTIRIVFDGDYVDRSPMDVHNLLYILSFAVKYSKYVRLLRGNHEEITINSHYGFKKNVELYFDEGKELFSEIENLFANLPLMYVLTVEGKRTLVLHGGLPIYDTEPTEMPEIPQIFSDGFYLDSRFENVENMDELSQQILWNDPALDLPPEMYYLPSRRGIGFNFGRKVFDKWLEVNKIDRLIRAHEVFLDGHSELFDEKLFSLFSSSHYVGRDISAKILKFDFTKKFEENWKYKTIQKDL